NGHVLVVGGNTSGVKFTDANGVLQPESWDPDTDTWTLHNPQAEARNYHSTGVLLTDGTVLSAGGGLNGNANVDHWNGEIFYPPYLYLPDGSLAPRPSITSGPDLMRTGGTYTFTATPGVPHWSLIKMSATTHTMNTDQRYLPVSFEETAAGTYALSLHNNVNVLTPGFWMLFAVDAAGVPSVSAVVQIVTTGAPRAVAPPEQFNRVGDAIELTIEARDPDGDPIGFVANGLPPGLEMDPVTGVIAGVVAEAGIFDVTVIIDDGTDLAVLAFRWLVTSRSNNSEFGRETDDHSANQWHPVQLTKLYFDPVVVMGPLTINGADPTTMRVRNVGGNGFEWAMDEWDYKDGSHTTETVSWLAVDAGTYQLPNGSTLLASHTAAVDTGWSAVAFE
ncbi:MAG: DUF1929 domain-containing protein, partial [Actinomycetia bacterium]|nr:DUF1929 domain-containing protein [Actinomycetes bacterium]